LSWRGPRQIPGLDQHLEPITDAQHGLARLDEMRQGLAQAMVEIVGPQSPRSQVIAVREPARDHQHLIVSKQALAAK